MIRWFASRQHDVVARRQLLRAGVSRHAIDGRVARGALIPLHRGVYVLGAARLRHRSRLIAATLCCPDGAVVSDRSAGELWALLPDRRGPVHVTFRHAVSPRPGIATHRSTSLAEATTVRDGIACTTLPRTLVDLADDVGGEAAGRAWSTLAGRRELQPAAVDRELRRHPTRPGSAVIARLLDGHRRIVTGHTRSQLENAAVAMCVRAGLPLPRVNTLIDTASGMREADLVWDDVRLVAEIDCWGTHGHAVAFRDDRRRDFDLDLEGWATVRLLPEDVIDDADRTAARISRLRDRRAGAR
ncbi:MAG: type IV toxin-antitoxin system AbiEi family antitoxin domain-containing protein [Solirubrobacteraceae bacterium]|nr:type IV toxin-antitoxin system AbiEi family antitoxin domain-containing protein [Solirubrobacteraceae bacterium]